MPQPADVESALREAHEACFMEQDRLCEQTCDMPDGLATSVCEGLHAAIDRLAAVCRLAQAERIATLFAKSLDPYSGGVPCIVSREVEQLRAEWRRMQEGNDVQR